MMITRKVTDWLYIFRDSVDCYANLVIGENGALLFDTCCGVDNLKQAVREVTDLPLTVLASHGHFDHIGGSIQFAKVYLAKEDRVILDSYNEEILHKWIMQMCPDAQDAVASFGADEWKQIAELDFTEVDLGGITCEIIHLPGHSLGSVGVYIREWKYLLSGDALTPIITLFFMNHGSRRQQLETFYKVKELDFTHFLTSHSEKVYEKALVEEMIACLEASPQRKGYQYQYPKPPYGTGYFYLYSNKEEPVGLIVESEEDMKL